MSQRDPRAATPETLSGDFELSTRGLLFETHKNQITGVHASFRFLLRGREVEDRLGRNNRLRMRPEQLNVLLPGFDSPRDVIHEPATTPLEFGDLADDLCESSRHLNVHSRFCRQRHLWRLRKNRHTCRQNDREDLHGSALFFFSFALRVRAAAAAFEAFVAIALRRSGVNFFARAAPPRLAMAVRYLEIASLVMCKI